jgi:glycosyltransferase involved in cell wall biosynthesis
MNKRRVLFTGFEIGGQLQLLTEKFRERGIEATCVTFNQDWRNYKADIKIEGKSFFKRFLFMFFAVFHYDVFHFFWGVSLFSFWRFHLLDLPILKLLNKRVYPHFRGLDVVDIKYFDYLRERRRTRDLSLKEPKMSRKDQLSKLRKWKRYSDDILVSEPDLFFVDDKAKLFPQVIDLKYWKTDRKRVFSKEKIKIAHSPTSRRKKGTDFIIKAIEDLKGKGYDIELVLIENMESHAVKRLYEDIDIGIDQILYGWHGKVSCEFMAMGIPTLCYIREEYYKYRPDLPIVNANPENLADKLEDLINNLEYRKNTSEKGIEYVGKYHDVEKEVDRLIQLYGFEDYRDKRFQSGADQSMIKNKW